jgi:hypothetical protein
MSRLNYASLSDAFYLGSDKIKNTQDEINKLRKIIGDSNLSKSKNETISRESSSSSTTENFSSTGQSSSESKPNKITYSEVSSFETDILKIMQNPKFDDFVKNYVIVKHPDWVNIKGTSDISVKNNYSKSTFGVNSSVNNYLIFFIISLLLYLWLKKLFNN